MQRQELQRVRSGRQNTDIQLFNGAGVTVMRRMKRHIPRGSYLNDLHACPCEEMNRVHSFFGLPCLESGLPHQCWFSHSYAP